jgi:hypothetical protein
MIYLTVELYKSRCANTMCTVLDWYWYCTLPGEVRQNLISPRGFYIRSYQAEVRCWTFRIVLSSRELKTWKQTTKYKIRLFALTCSLIPPSLPSSLVISRHLYSQNAISRVVETIRWLLSFLWIVHLVANICIL